jgi:thiol-disulfide isomerase/thioredoxin
LIQKCFRSLLCIVLLLSLNVRAEDGPKLKVGDAAPKLAVGKWVKGEPVEAFEKGKIYVLECWATWCGPCIASIPEVSKMNTEFKDKGVVIIGMNVWERNVPGVEPFVKNMGDKMNYRVAMDQGNTTATTWLAAAGMDGIPCAFIVGKEGKIAWIGHPAAMKTVIEKVIAGTYDPKKEAETALKRDEIEARMMKANESGDFDKMLKISDEMVALDPSTAAPVGVMKFKIYFHEKKDYPTAYALAKKLAENELKENAQALNDVSWTILDTPGVAKRDVDLALQIIEQADKLQLHTDPAILDTLARAHSEKGALDKALEIQTLAVSKVEDNEELKADLTKTLQKYKAAVEEQKAKAVPTK